MRDRQQIPLKLTPRSLSLSLSQSLQGSRIELPGTDEECSCLIFKWRRKTRFIIKDLTLVSCKRWSRHCFTSCYAYHLICRSFTIITYSVLAVLIDLMASLHVSKTILGYSKRFVHLNILNSLTCWCYWCNFFNVWQQLLFWVSNTLRQHKYMSVGENRCLKGQIDL